MEFDDLSRSVIGYAIEVHRNLGPGLLESTYRQCLAHELSQAGISFQMELPLPVRYKGILLDCGYRIDPLVNGDVIVEIKSVESVLPIHHAETLTCACRIIDQFQRHKTIERHQTLCPFITFVLFASFVVNR
jgi:GxxExxY protein